MLAVGVERESGRGPLGDRMAETGLQGLALAAVRSLAKNAGAGGFRDPGGVVGRAVVDDEDREMAGRALDDRGDPGCFVVGGYEREDGSGRTSAGTT